MSSTREDHYEATRARHIAYARKIMRPYVMRLFWSREEIVAEQTRALQDLLRHAVEHSPWHRARLRGLDVEHFTSADLEKIPPMTKKDLMQHWDDIVADPRCTLAKAEEHLANLNGDDYFLEDLHVVHSGGSSGERGVFLYDWHGWAVSVVGLMRGIYAMRGKGLPGPIASLSACASGHATSALLETFSDPECPNIRAPITLPMADLVGRLNRTQPSALHTYPSFLPHLCDEARQGRLRIKPLLVWCTSETLLPEVRALAEATWNVPVLNHWGASESNGGAFCCAHGPGFHIAEDLNIIEPVDLQRKPVPAGEWSKRILMTNLYNRVMPLIRFEINDEFQVADCPCACGSAYLNVLHARGRLDDVFEYPGNISVHVENFEAPLGKQAVVEYQVRQTERGVDVDLIALNDVNLEALHSDIMQRLANLGLVSPEVKLCRKKRLDRLPTGKLKRFIALGSITRILETNRIDGGE